jgi:hypothetical protein
MDRISPLSGNPRDPAPEDRIRRTRSEPVVEFLRETVDARTRLQFLSCCCCSAAAAAALVRLIIERSGKSFQRWKYRKCNPDPTVE